VKNVSELWLEAGSGRVCGETLAEQHLVVVWRPQEVNTAMVANTQKHPEAKTQIKNKYLNK
jgi:hypothetical protein